MARTLLLPLLAGWLILAACEPAPPATAPNDSTLTQQQELERGGMDFSNVVVVRLLNEGQRIEVTSVLPAIVADHSVGGHPAKTIFRLDATGGRLTLFSRDIGARRAIRVDMPLAELESKKGFAFPVVQPDGSVKEQSFRLEAILRPKLTTAGTP